MLGSSSLVFGFFLTFNEVSIGIILIIVGALLSLIFVYRTIKLGKIKRYYKETYRLKIIDFLLQDSNYTFNENGVIDKTIFDDSQFVYNYQEYKGRDKLTINIPNDDGSKSNNYLTLCDLMVFKTEEDKDGISDKVMVYNGAFGYNIFLLSLSVCYV